MMLRRSEDKYRVNSSFSHIFIVFEESFNFVRSADNHFVIIVLLVFEFPFSLSYMQGRRVTTLVVEG
jgi:hypothetical protein